MNNKNNATWTTISLVVFIGLMAFSYVYKSLLKSNIMLGLTKNSNCDLRKEACFVILPDGAKVNFSIVPKDIPLLKPLILTVKVEGLNVNDVKVQFKGVDMDMGMNISTLSSTAEKDNTFTGKGMLSLCTHKKMEWEADVLLRTDRGDINVPYRFYTVRK